MNKLESLDYIIIFSYFLIMLLMGLWFIAKRSKSAVEFSIADKNMSGWALGCSLMVTYISSIAFLAMPAKSFSSNWAAYAMSFSSPVLAWITAKYFIPFYRSTSDICSFSHLRRQFGNWASMYAVICYVISYTIWMGTILYLISIVLSMMTGIESKYIIILTGLVVTAYTCIGGIKAVIWTDVLQCFILIAGAAFCLYFILSSIPGGLTQAHEIAIDHKKFSLGNFNLNFSESTFWVYLITGFTLNLQTFGIAQGFVQRYFAAKSTKAASSSIYISTALYLGITALFFLIGTYLYSFYQVFPERLPDEIIAQGNDSIYPYFIVTELPIGLKGLLIAAILAAAMSSIDSGINSIATAVYSELYLPTIGAKSLSIQPMNILYLFSFASGILSIIAAETLKNFESILDAWWEMDSIFSGGTLGLFILGFIAKKIKKPGAVISLIIGTCLIFWIALSQLFSDSHIFPKLPLHSFMTLFVGSATIILVGIIIDRLTYYRNKAKLNQWLDLEEEQKS